MKKGRLTPIPDNRQTSKNIDFFNTIRTLCAFAASAKNQPLDELIDTNGGFRSFAACAENLIEVNEADIGKLA